MSDENAAPAAECEVEGQASMPEAPDQNPDAELASLLDDALKDFGKSVKPTDAGGSGDGLMGATDEGGSSVVTQEMAQRAAKEFQTMLSQLAKVQQTMIEKEGATPDEAAAGASGSGIPDLGGSPPVGADMLASMEALAQNAQKIADAQTEEDFLKGMTDLGEGDAAAFLPFMQSLMSNLLSKENMYPPMKEMSDKYPQWLRDNADNLSDDDRTKYEKQHQLCNELCTVYESLPDDEKEMKDGDYLKLDRVMTLMQQMQACGLPPESLVGEMPPGWELDSQSGLPNVKDPSQAAESCTLM